MKKLNQALMFLVICAFLQPSTAYARGGSCGEGVFCTLTGLAVGLILFVIFLPPVLDDIKEKGFIKGLVKHIFASYFVIVFGIMMVLFVLKNLYTITLQAERLTASALRAMN